MREDGSWSVVKPTLENVQGLQKPMFRLWYRIRRYGIIWHVKRVLKSSRDIPLPELKYPSCYFVVDITVAAHDTTGGMKTKISEAAVIAKLGIDVYIVKVTCRISFLLSHNLNLWVFRVLKYFRWEQAGTSHSLRALSGELRSNIPDDWLGTVIRFSKWKLIGHGMCQPHGPSTCWSYV